MSRLRVGTRGSALALAQARWVAARIEGAEIVEIATSGDAARAVGDKSRWVSALEAAAGWKTSRIQRPVAILGQLDGVMTGIRQLRRTRPLEIELLRAGIRNDDALAK